MKKQARNYRIIEYLNTQARTSYLARIRNPNREMPDFDLAYAGGLTKARHHYDHKHHKEHGHGKEMHGDDHGIAKPMNPAEHPAETGHPPDPHH
jgi:molybdopterin-containing oxidoreductase family iron-sulfur binding subunit